MKIRDPKTGKILRDSDTAVRHFCNTNCQDFEEKACPLAREAEKVGSPCLNWARNNLVQAVHLMGFQAVPEKPNWMKGDIPYLCERFGVEPYELFTTSDTPEYINYIDEIGQMYSKHSTKDKFHGVGSVYLCTLLEQPDRIIRTCPGKKTVLTPEERAICRAIPGAKYLSRNNFTESVVCVWAEKPVVSINGLYCSSSENELGHLLAKCFPSIQPGDLVCLETSSTSDYL